MRNWHEISKDPNAPAVLEYRRNCLINAKSNELIKDRIKYTWHGHGLRFSPPKSPNAGGL